MCLEVLWPGFSPKLICRYTKFQHFSISIFFFFHGSFFFFHGSLFYSPQGLFAFSIFFFFFSWKSFLFSLQGLLLGRSDLFAFSNDSHTSPSEVQIRFGSHKMSALFFIIILSPKFDALPPNFCKCPTLYTCHKSSFVGCIVLSLALDQPLEPEEKYL